jgi:hypothetical protein
MGSRRRARIAVPVIVTAGAALLGGVVAPLPARAQADQPVDVTLAYTCTPPDAPGLPVTLALRAGFPLEAVVGDAVLPTDPVLSLSAPPAAFTALTDAGAVRVTAVVSTDMRVDHPSGPTTDTWSAFVDPAVEVPAEGDWVLEAPASVPFTFMNEAGAVLFTPGALTVSVTGYTAEGAVTEPPTADLTCTPDQETTIAIIVVSGGEEPPPPDIPQECHEFEGVNPEYFNWFCSYMGGYANVAKLNASVLQPAGMQNIATTQFSFECAEGPGILCFRARTMPDFEGEPQLPPAPGSFWAFGFVPVTGTLRITQPEPSDIYAWSTFDIPPTGLTTIKVKLSARIEDTTVNGVPLDVGENCRTAVPIDATFTGNYENYSITDGGVLTGTITIPPFSGCGVDEDLDPIVTGLVSGPGNFVKLTQGNVCYFLNGTGFCPPDKPEIQR